MADDAILSKIAQTVDNNSRATLDKLDSIIDAINSSGGTTAKQAKRDHGTNVRIQGTLDKLLSETQNLVRAVRGGGGGRSGNVGGGIGGGGGPNQWTVNQMIVRNAIFQNVQGLGGAGGNQPPGQGGGAPGAAHPYMRDAILALAGAVGYILKEMLEKYIQGYVKQQQTGVTQFWNAFLPKWLGGLNQQLGGKDLQELSIEFKQAALAAGSFSKFGDLVSQTMTDKLKIAAGHDLKMAGEVAAQTQETVRLIAGRNVSDAELITETNKLTGKFADLRHLSTLQVKELSSLVNGMAKNWSLMSGLSERQRQAVINQTLELYKNKDMLGLSAQRLKEFAEAAAAARKDSAKDRINNAARLAQAAVLAGRGDLVGDLMKGAITGKQSVETMRELGGALQGMQQEAVDQAENGNIAMLAFYNNVQANILDPMSDSLKRQLDIAQESETVAKGLRPQATIESLEAERAARGRVADTLDEFSKTVQELDQALRQLTNGAASLGGIWDTVKSVLLGIVGLRVVLGPGGIGRILGGLGGAGAGAAGAGGAGAAGAGAAGAAAAGGTSLAVAGAAVLGSAAVGAALGTAINYGVEKLSGISIGSHIYELLNKNEFGTKEDQKKEDEKRWQIIQQRKTTQTNHLEKVAEKTEAQVTVAQQQLNELKKISEAGSTQTESLTKLVDAFEEFKSLQGDREKIKPVKSGYR